MMQEIRSSQHPAIKHLTRLRLDTKYRKKCGEVVVSGEKVVREVSKGAKIKFYLLSGSKKVGGPSTLISHEIMKKITGLEEPEDIAAVVEIPQNIKPFKKELLLVLDRISDPGNLGALIRTAYAFSFDAIILTPNSVDPFNDKVIRASKGFNFLIPVVKKTVEEIQSIVKQNRLNVYAADLRGEEVKKVRFQRPLLLILGNEAEGLDLWAQKLGKKINIDISKDVDSLNVASAGAIIMHLIKTA